jgi:hypothetical protein
MMCTLLARQSNAGRKAVRTLSDLFAVVNS